MNLSMRIFTLFRIRLIKCMRKYVLLRIRLIECMRIYVLLAPHRASWRLLGLPGASWGILAPPGASWRLPGASRVVWVSDLMQKSLGPSKTIYIA